MLVRHFSFGDLKQFAVAFASVVTTSASSHDWVARNGDDSLYALMKFILPQVGIAQKNSHTC